MKKDATPTTKEVKGKILSRIQEQLKRKEDDPMDYVKCDFHEKGPQYMKGPVPIVPITE